jgi:hypothetical protein
LVGTIISIISAASVTYGWSRRNATFLPVPKEKKLRHCKKAEILQAPSV